MNEKLIGPDVEGSLAVPLSDDSLLIEAVQQFRQALEMGQALDRNAFLARYPDLAEQLAPCLDGLLLLRGALPVAAPWELLPGDPNGKVLGDFRLLREVGRGGMGVVYEAVQLALHRRVALKVLLSAPSLDARQLQRFRNEALAAAALNHPHIVGVHGVGSEGSVCYYAMQFIDGRTLADVIRDLCALETNNREHFRRAAEWIRQAALALEYAHSVGVVHRDVKPSNLLIDRQGRLFVADFGLAHVSGDDALTRTGDFLGTLCYMAPEQARGERAVDPRRDVYGLGVTLYELLTLRRAFTGTSRQTLLRAVLEEDPAPARKVNRAVPVELEVIAHKAMARKPADRYASAGALADDLRCWLDDQPITARPPTLHQKAQRWARRHPAVVAALLVGVLMGVLTAAATGVWRERLHGQEQARQAVRDLQLSDALDEAEGRLRQRRVAEARAALARAEGILASEVTSAPRVAGESSRERAEQLRRDLDLLTRLELLSLESARTDVAASQFNEQRAVPLFREALQRYGLRRERSPARLAEWLLGSAVRDEVLAALEWWAFLTRDKHERQWIEEMLRAVGRSEAEMLQLWNQAVARRDGERLKALASRLKVERLPPLRLLRLARQLGALAGSRPQVELLRRARQPHAGDFWINHYLGIALLSTRPPDIEEATHYLTAAVSLRPDSAGAWVNLGNVLRLRGQLNAPRPADSRTGLDAAIVAFREAIRRQPDYAAAHFDLGLALTEQGKSDAAIAAFREAIRQQRDHVGAHYQLGVALHVQRKLVAATAAYREAIRLKPALVRAHHNLGNALKDQGKFADAVTAYREAIRLRPTSAEAHYHVGVALQNQGILDEAIAAYWEAIRLRPGHAEAHCNLGFLLLRKGESTKALALLRRGHELGSKRATWKYPSQEWVRQAEEAVAREKKSPANLKRQAD